MMLIQNGDSPENITGKETDKNFNIIKDKLEKK